MCVEIHMPQDVYIYNPHVPVPKNVRHVEIPKGVTVIREDAFRNCSDLQSVTIPDGVTKIDQYAFRGCSGLQSIVIPDSVTEIVAGAFWGCAGLQSVTIPDGVTEIGNHVFAYCVRLQSVTIPDSVTEIGMYVFSGCSRLQSVTISKNIRKIAPYAFDNCFELQSVVIRDGVTEIGTKAFHNCKSLQSVTIPDSITKIGNYAFEDCSALQSVRIPGRVTEIGYSAFTGCSGLQSITIPDGVHGIKDCAFQNCTALQSVTIPDSVTEIGYKAFGGCSNLQSVTIPDGVTEIGKYAFDDCSGLVTVTIPESVTKIEEGTFYECSGLRSIAIPENVTEIGYSAFEKCTGLQSVTIPESVTEIREGTFYECSGLQSIVIPENVTEIGYSAFEKCAGLQSVTIPDGIEMIHDHAFARCPALRSLTYKGINIAPFINTDGYGVNIFGILKTLVEHRIPLSESTVKFGIDMAHQYRLSEWLRGYPVFGTMRLPSAVKSADEKTEEYLRWLFATQKKTGCHIPNILNRLAVTAHICQIPPERLAETFDIGYTKNLLGKNIPLVPATACRCYYDRGTCDMLIQKNKISVMAEAITRYNRSEHRECYRHLMDFVLSHPDTKTEDLQYATDHAEDIPIRANTTLAQIRQHRTYMESLTEVTQIEAKYGAVVPGFRLSDYPCRIDPVSITYAGMTARVLNLSNEKDIALATRLGELTCCCQRLGRAGETAMMHGFLNPDAGFWVIEDRNGEVKAQAEIWKTDNGNLVFDNIEFANTDKEHLSDRAEQLRGVIAAWAMESGYKNIIMGCGYNELGVDSMEPAPIPELRLTPEEVFALQKDNDAGVSFRNINEVRRYMRTWAYRTNNFVYTDADEKCVYIKKNGTVSDYLMKGYDCALAKKHSLPEDKTEKERGDAIICG